MNVLLALGLVTAVAAFGGLAVLFLDARSRHLDGLRAHARSSHRVQGRNDEAAISPVGRTTFWDALVDWRTGQITRDAAADVMARRYQEWADIFERQALQQRESDRLARRALRRWENEGGHL